MAKGLTVIKVPFVDPTDARNKGPFSCRTPAPADDKAPAKKTGK
jgi:hypothetical protein